MTGSFIFVLDKIKILLNAFQKERDKNAIGSIRSLTVHFFDIPLD